MLYIDNNVTWSRNKKQINDENFMKIFVNFIWVLQHSDLNFNAKNNFANYVKNCLQKP